MGESDEETTEARKEVKEMYAALTGDDVRQTTAKGLVEGVLLLSYDEGEEASEALEVSCDRIQYTFGDL